MKKILTYILCLLPMLVAADTLSDILNDTYKQQTLSDAEQDSLLNPTPDSRYTLRESIVEKIYRHSYLATYEVYDTLRHTNKRLTDHPVREATMSPNGRYIAYCDSGKLKLYKTDYGTTTFVRSATSPHPFENAEKNELSEGQNDWLYEEEFTTTGTICFSPDNKMLAFIMTDESDVDSFEWETYLKGGNCTALLDGDNGALMYPQTKSLRYPKAGTGNPKVYVAIYDIPTKGIKIISLPGQDKEHYIPRILWTRDADPQLLIERINRDQNELDIYQANPKSGLCTALYKEKNANGHVDYSIFDEWQLLSDGQIIVVHEKSGYRQAYLYSPKGQELRQLTPGGKDITAVYGYDEKSNTLYYQQATTPQTREVYALNIKNAKSQPVLLSNKNGWNSARISRDASRLLLASESLNHPVQYTLYKLNGAKTTAIVSPAVQQINQANQAIQKEWQTVGPHVEKTWFSFSTERGDVLEGWSLNSTPDATIPKPVVLTQYSGPESQRVVDKWKKTWDYALAELGYLVVCVDVRGTGARGREWRNETYMQLGAKEAEDLISTAHHIATWPQADGERIALVGWSYGGYQVLRTMCDPKNNGVFKAGIAIAPVTDWRLYDSAYTERYMRRVQVNETGYNEASLLNKAYKMKGELLLVHGLADDNVHAQHTLLLTEQLVQAGVQFEEQLYVDDNHHLRKRSNYEHLHRRLVKFLNERL